jgi:hypothetical protein
MPLQLTIEGNAAAALGELSSELKGGAVKAAMGGAGKRLLVDWFARLDAERANALGGKRTHFYADAARSVSYTADDNGVSLSIRKLGLAQRRFGGTIEPVNAKMLAIPARAEAYGHRPREFNFLEIVVFKDGGRLIGLGETARQEIKIRNIRRKDKKTGVRYTAGRRVEAGEVRGGAIWYWLVRSVTQQPDPSVLPPDALMLDAVVAAALTHIQNLKGRM